MNRRARRAAQCQPQLHTPWQILSDGNQRFLKAARNIIGSGKPDECLDEGWGAVRSCVLCYLFRRSYDWIARERMISACSLVSSLRTAVYLSFNVYIQVCHVSRLKSHRVKRASFQPESGVIGWLRNRQCTFEHETVWHPSVLSPLSIHVYSTPSMSTVRIVHVRWLH